MNIFSFFAALCTQERFESLENAFGLFFKSSVFQVGLLSLNVRGLGNFLKRRAIFTWCRKQKADLIFLQETHATKNCESQWKKEWGSSIVFSHEGTNARGVAVLIRSGLDIVIQHEHCDSKGRVIMLSAKIKDKN